MTRTGTPGTPGAASMRQADRSRAGRRRLRRYVLRVQAPLLLALVVLWLALWGHVDLISLATGIAFALGVVRVFHLPAVSLSGRFNPLWFLAFAGLFLGRLLAASFQVAWIALRPVRQPRSSVIRVPLRTRSDFILTLVAEVSALVPGSVLVETDRYASTLYLHVLDGDDEAKLRTARDEAHEFESLLALALGTRDDIWRIDRDRAARGLGRLPAGRRQLAHDLAREEQHARRTGEPRRIGPDGAPLGSAGEVRRFGGDGTPLGDAGEVRRIGPGGAPRRKGDGA